MKLVELPHEFDEAKPILKTIEAAGFEAYFVGGCVRDTILGQPIHDVDIATSAYPEEVKALFDRTVDTGIEHGTVMVLDHGEGYEITTFRTESTYQDFRRPDSVTFVRSLTEDLKRRDFTINALAMRENGEIIDLFDGLSDLDQHLIRAVGVPEERFHEDALRMMRAVRFASQLNFNIHDETLIAISDNAPLLAKIAVERIQVEFIKMLMGQNVERGLDALVQTSMSEYCPELADKQRELTALAQTMTQQITDEVVAWGLLLVQLKVTGTKVIHHFMTAWKTSNHLSSAVQIAVQTAIQLLEGQHENWLLYSAGVDGLNAAITIALNLGAKIDAEALLAQYEQLAIKDKNALQANGNDLIQAGMRPGPQLGHILRLIEQAVVAGTLENEQAAILAFAKAEGENE